ncbi:MAG: hypothetical protein JNM69_04505 [Archangium sp.]|nr:hypothetical protein [Archangium sp.]
MTSPERWARLSSVGFALDGGAVDVAAALDTVLEVFDASADPVDDFEGVAVRRFVLSLRAALEARARGQGLPRGGPPGGVHRSS